jgi:hypothetical protein
VRRAFPITALLGILIAASPAAAAERDATPGTPRLGHVFVIVLENENADESFGPAAPAYLAKTLPARGAFVPNYYATGHLSLDNYISMVSGQAPNPQTQADCQIFSQFVPGTPTDNGQVIGSGCVYPDSVPTIADQLEDAKRDWGGYMEDLAAKAPEEPKTCRHPEIGSVDDTQSAEEGDQYATRHNPFIYFHSIIDEQASCDAHVVDLKKLSGDLSHNRTTPAYSFITPNLCHDGHDEPCVDGEPGGLVSANRFLASQVPKILHSSAFKHRGLLMVTFDEAEAEGDGGDSSACCGEQPGPNTPDPGGPVPGPGGGRVGAVMISPCIGGGTVDRTAYNHYSMLRSFEDGLGLDHLGYAGQDGLKPFGPKIFTRPSCGERIHLTAHAGRAHAGKRKVKFHVRSGLARCRRGVRIRFADRRVLTDRKGRATIMTGRDDPKPARARKKGCLPDSFAVQLSG